MANPTSSKFDDDDVNDDELLAALNEDNLIPNQSESIVPIDNPPIVEVSSFGFPFEPYQIQVDFMRGLYSTIQQRKHGIFESPTGTVIYSSIIIVNYFLFILKGKSLSLICGSLRWLFDEIQSWKDEYEELLKPVETKTDSSEDWLKRLMKRKEEETAREKRRVSLTVYINPFYFF